jgi:hypothetical protein
MIERPDSCPKEGQIEAFDAGWNAAKVGLSRETVAVISHPSAKEWALLAWDAYRLIERKTNG